MIESNGRYFAYRHIRMDKNEPFYIGIGTTQNYGVSEKTRYKRAFHLKGRNEIWSRIANKTTVSIEILFETNSATYLQEKETEFIRLYGRLDNKTGILANLTDGGKAHLHTSKLSSEKRINTYKKRGIYDKFIENSIATLAKSRHKLLEVCQKKTYLYDINGLLLKVFNSFNEAALFTKQSPDSVRFSMTGNRNHKKYIFSFTDYGVKMDLSKINITYRNKDKRRAICKISNDGTAILETYESIKKASEINNMNAKSINTYLREPFKKYRYKGHYWRYAEDAASFIENKTA
jgi:hypothetical protein